MRRESASSLDDASRCLRKYYFSRVLGIQTETSEAQSFGKVVDEALEIYHGIGDEDATMAVIQRASCMQSAKNVELLLHMIPDYIKWDKKNPFPQGIVKTQFDYASLDFADKGVLLHGKPDLIIELPEKVLVIDHKTAAHPWSYDDVLMNLQGEIYSYLVGSEIKKPVEMVFNVLYKKFASPPSINQPDKNGVRKVSRAGCTTTQELYLAAIQEVGGDPNDYRDILAKLGAEVFFERLTATYDRKGTKYLLECILNDVNRIRNKFPRRSVTTLCRTTCSFYPTCIAAGNDPDKAIEYIRGNGLSKEV